MVTATNAELSEALSSNYMLVSLSISLWSGKRVDKAATAELIQQKGAAQDSGAFQKKLLASADTELKDVQAAGNALRSFLYSRTLPWTTSSEGAKRGERLVPTSEAMNFLKDVATLKKNFDDAVINLQQVWPARVQQAMSALSGLADMSDYPQVSELPSLFNVTVDIRPLPAVGDFSRLNVPAQLATALGNRMATQLESQVQNAMDDLKERMLDELQRMATQMEKLSQGEKTKLYGTLITNMQGLVGLARSMNLKGSTKLNDLADRIESSLLKLPLEAYKNDISRAATAAAAAKAIIAEAEQPDVWY